MARLMALCSLPRTEPRDRKEYARSNGPYTLVMTAGYQPEASLREHPALADRVGNDRGRANAIPCAGSRTFAFRVHAQARNEG